MLIASAAAALAAGLLVYGWFEAGWVRTRVLDVPVDGLPAGLVGLRIAHLSDFHLGVPSRGALAAERAVDWVVERRPDLVCVTGDLLSHPRGRERLERLLDRLDAYLVLGNHDVGVARDPFSLGGELEALHGTLLRDDARVVETSGGRIEVAGIHPRPYRSLTERARTLPDLGADLRLLLSHYPVVASRLPPGHFQLVLAGHMHAGQIVLPYPGGRLLLAHPRAPESHGLYRYGATILHVSPGLGTTFVPFRFFARPEVTELVLRARGRT